MPDYKTFGDLSVEEQKRSIPVIVRALRNEKTEEEAISLLTLNNGLWEPEAWAQARLAVPELNRHLKCTKPYWDHWEHEAGDKWPVAPCFRDDVIKILGDMGSGAGLAGPALLVSLSESWEAFKSTGQEPRWGQLEKLLGALVSVGPPLASAPILREMARNPKFYGLAEKGLGKIGKKNLETAKAEIPGLLWSVEHDTGTAGLAAALALIEIGGNALEAVPQLSRLLKSGNPYVRDNAALVLAEIAPPSKDLSRVLAGRSDARCQFGAFSFGVSILDHALLREEEQGLDAGRYSVWVDDPMSALHAGLGIEEFSFLRPTKGQASVCDNVLALPIDDSRVAAFVETPTSDAPSLSIFVYDAAGHRVDGALGAVGCAVDDELRIQRLGKGAAFKCDYGCEGGGYESIQGTKVIDSRLCELEEWRDIVYANGKIDLALDKDLTWRNSDLRRFFLSKDAFEHAFGLDDLNLSEGKKRRRYDSATLKDGRGCLKLFGSSEWRCLDAQKAGPRLAQ